jgi:ABC-2 type transport system permease protein
VSLSAGLLGGSAVVRGEARKIPAFLRRDLLVTLSYRAAFVSDLLALFTQAVLFYFVGRLVDPSKLPRFGQEQVSYLEFAAIGIALSVFIQVGLTRVAVAMRGEQLMGTLESILVTPTSAATVQLGSVVFDLIYVPVRTAAFLVVLALAFGLDFRAAGILPAALALVAVVPFVWGLGLLGAAAILTFRRGAGVTGLAGTILVLGAGAYFPLDLLPGWVTSLAEHNPIAVVLDDMRGALLGDLGWTSIAGDLPLLAGAAAASLAVGMLGFRLALARERRNGTLGLY